MSVCVRHTGIQKSMFAVLFYCAYVRKCPRQSKGMYADVVCLWDVCSQAPKISKEIDADVVCVHSAHGQARKRRDISVDVMSVCV